jgi:hypothetical protein
MLRIMQVVYLQNVSIKLHTICKPSITYGNPHDNNDDSYVVTWIITKFLPINSLGQCFKYTPLLLKYWTGGQTPQTELPKAIQWHMQVSQEESARLREGVPYGKVYRYNPKHICRMLNGYGDNGQRKVWSTCGSIHCRYQLTSLNQCLSLRVVSFGLTPAVVNVQTGTWRQSLPVYSAWKP